MSTKQKLLALAAALAALGAGVYFINFNNAEVTTLPESFGALEVFDRSKCTVSACGAAECLQANAVLADAGTGCSTRVIECPVRFGARVRAMAVDAGVSFSAAKYQQVRIGAVRCPAAGGGFAFGIPTDDDGWPLLSMVTGTPGCKYRPVGAVCTRLDGGDQGDLNQGLATELTGAGCVPVVCGVVAGDVPEGS